MRLNTLEPQLIAAKPDGWHDVATLAEADGVHFNCPKCGGHEVLVWFSGRNVPAALEPKPRWMATGSDLENLTLTPSINILSGCQWHGFVNSGEVTGA